MNTNTQITYQFNAIDKASDTLSQIINSLQQINTLQKNTEKLNIGVNKTREVAQATEKININTQKMSKSLGKTINLMATAKKSVGFITDALKESSSWTENLHMFEVSFGSASGEAYKFAKTIVNAFGTSQNEVVQYTALFNQMASAIGLATGTAEKMSYALTALGYDIASLYNLSIETSMEKLRAGIAGQTKPLRQLGMDITAQTLDTYLKDTLKLTNITSKMLNQSDKMLLRTIVIMKQATNTYGDMAETINSFANQVKVLQGSLTNFKLAVGDLAKTFLAPVVSGISGFIIALTSIIRAFVPEEAETGIENIATAIGSVNDELEETNKKMGLLSFDKFNALNKGSKTTGFADMTDILESEFFTIYEDYMNSFNKAMSTIENKANEIALSITKWAFPLTEFDEETGQIKVDLSEINWVLKALYETLKIIIALKITSMLAKLPMLLEVLGNAIINTTTKTKVLNSALTSLSLFGFVYGLIQLITNWNKMDTAMKVVIITLTALCGVLWIVKSRMWETIAITGLYLKDAIVKLTAGIWNLIKALAVGLVNALKTMVTWLGTLSASTWMCIGGFATLAAGIAVLAINWDKMGSWQKVITIFSALTAAAIAAAIAIGVFHASWTMGIGAAAIAAGVTLIIGSMAAAKSATKFEDGGYPETGTLFWANENGPEVVANVGGGQTGVMNLTQFEEACYRGTLRAITTSGIDRLATKKPSTTSININGRELARAVVHDIANEANRQNVKFK